MDQLNKIDYMIKSLYLAKDEIKYAQEYNLRKGNDETMGRDFYSGYGYNHRTPNGTIIRVILSILVYTLFSRMFDLMQPPAVKHSIAVV